MLIMRTTKDLNDQTGITSRNPINVHQKLQSPWFVIKLL